MGRTAKSPAGEFRLCVGELNPLWGLGICPLPIRRLPETVGRGLFLCCAADCEAVPRMCRGGRNTKCVFCPFFAVLFVVRLSVLRFFKGPCCVPPVSSLHHIVVVFPACQYPSPCVASAPPLGFCWWLSLTVSGPFLPDRVRAVGSVSATDTTQLRQAP